VREGVANGRYLREAAGWCRRKAAGRQNSSPRLDSPPPRKASRIRSPVSL
jgi:hypothetical protein